MSIHKRKRRVPSVKGLGINVKDISDQDQRETFERLDKAREELPKLDMMEELSAVMLPHEHRKLELSRIHNIPEKDIFVDAKNGVELFRTDEGNWVHNPMYRGM